MRLCKSRAALLAAAVLALSGNVLAAETGSREGMGQPGQPGAPTPAVAPAGAEEAAADRRPLMELLHQANLAHPLEDAGISIFGHIELGYTWNFDEPDSEVNAGRLFDFEHDEFNMHQLGLTVERAVDAAEKKWDIGGRVDFVYGADAGFMHSNGLFDWYDSPRDPENQWDLHQAYVDVTVPIGNGLLVRAGKFITPFGFEVINPADTTLFSHGYLFNFSAPFTHTGVLLTYALSDELSITGGFGRGWDQSTEDNNEALEFIGQVSYTVNETSAILFGVSAGPQLEDNEDDWRILLNVVLTCNPDDRWSFAVDSMFGWEEDSAGDGDDAHWWGIAGFAGYKINKHLAINGRIEYFRDDDGTRVVGIPANFYEATIGLTLWPFPDEWWGKTLAVRPELRGDWSNEDVFNDGEDDAMYTFGVDVVYGF